MSNFLTVIHKNRGRLLTSSLLLIIFTLLIEQTGRAEIAIITLTLAAVSLLLSYTGYVVCNTLQLNSHIEKLLADSTYEHTEKLENSNTAEKETGTEIKKQNRKPPVESARQVTRKTPPRQQ